MARTCLQLTLQRILSNGSWYSCCNKHFYFGRGLSKGETRMKGNLHVEIVYRLEGKLPFKGLVQNQSV